MNSKMTIIKVPWSYITSSCIPRFKRYVNHRVYSSVCNDLSGYWDRLRSSIDSVGWKEVFPGSIYASISFLYPYPRGIDFQILTLAFIRLLEQYAYHLDSDYAKFTIGYKMLLPQSTELSFTLGKAIPLFDPSGKRIHKKKIYDVIEQLVRDNGEKYNDAEIKGVFIRIYYEVKNKESHKLIHFPNDLADDILTHIHNVMESEIESSDLPDVKSLNFLPSRIPTKINTIKGKVTERRSFIVADLETLLVNNVHVPYAAGYLVVNPGDDLTSIPEYSIQTFFSEDQPLFSIPSFEERSSRMLFYFQTCLEVEVTYVMSA